MFCRIDSLFRRRNQAKVSTYLYLQTPPGHLDSKISGENRAALPVLQKEGKVRYDFLSPFLLWWYWSLQKTFRENGCQWPLKCLEIEGFKNEGWLPDVGFNVTWFQKRFLRAQSPTDFALKKKSQTEVGDINALDLVGMVQQMVVVDGGYSQYDKLLMGETNQLKHCTFMVEHMIKHQMIYLLNISTVFR